MITLHQQLQLLLHRRRRLLELRESHLDCAIAATAAAHSRRGVARNGDNDRNPLVSSRSLVCYEIGASKPPPPPAAANGAANGAATSGNGTRSAICSPSSGAGHPFAGPTKDVEVGAIALLQLVASDNGRGKCKRLVRRAREEGRAAQVRTSERTNLANPNSRTAQSDALCATVIRTRSKVRPPLTHTRTHKRTLLMSSSLYKGLSITRGGRQLAAAAAATTPRGALFRPITLSGRCDGDFDRAF